MSRLLTSLVLTGALVGAPALRVLCYSSCVLDVDPMAKQMIASDATPECHQRDEGHHSTPASDSSPLQDECTHSGESSSSSLNASVKFVGGDGPRVPSVSTVPPAHLSIASSDPRRESPPIPATGQRLGLFLTPLRI